jgi:hypothetical protein
MLSASNKLAKLFEKAAPESLTKQVIEPTSKYPAEYINPIVRQLEEPLDSFRADFLEGLRFENPSNRTYKRNKKQIDDEVSKQFIKEMEDFDTAKGFQEEATEAALKVLKDRDPNFSAEKYVGTEVLDKLATDIWKTALDVGVGDYKQRSSINRAISKAIENDQELPVLKKTSLAELLKLGKLSDSGLQGTPEFKAQEVAYKKAADVVANRISQLENQALEPFRKNRGSVVWSDSSAAGKPLAALAKKPEFYSEVARTVDNAKQSKMHGVQWANWLKNQPGIKPDELQWTGLDNWLRSQEKLVTKKEVQDYLAKNEIKVGDTEYRHLTPDEIRELDDLKYKRDHYDHEDDLIDQGKWDELEKGHLFSDDDLIRLETLQEAELPKYEEYQLPDGENYRENLYKLPSEKYHITAKELAERDGLVWEDLNGYDQMEYKDLARAAQFPEDTYRSSHWSEPNVLVHTRTNERTVGGEPSLHLEEVQSDWHQAGRKKGYAANVTKQKRARVEKEEVDTLLLKRG